ncbi:hypothetical protein C1H76_8470 [Elsinoe australis]|uniref:Uncharacterized protein n=1 Tax=Elsinoe australis TaxID=40998 RepID=A0A4U7AQQ3_9PEZI|nr:hypothetical protein C1H76_8470 [Elsinoe australis]
MQQSVLVYFSKCGHTELVPDEPTFEPCDAFFYNDDTRCNKTVRRTSSCTYKIAWCAKCFVKLMTGELDYERMRRRDVPGIDEVERERLKHRNAEDDTQDENNGYEEKNTGEKEGKADEGVKDNRDGEHKVSKGTQTDPT